MQSLSGTTYSRPVVPPSMTMRLMSKRCFGGMASWSSAFGRASTLEVYIALRAARYQKPILSTLRRQTSPNTNRCKGFASLEVKAHDSR